MERKLTIVIGKDELMKMMMAEYALSVAGKNDEKRMPLQYTRCNIESLLQLQMNAACVKIGSRLMGYVTDVEPGGEMCKIEMAVPSTLRSECDRMLRGQIERMMINDVLAENFKCVEGCEEEYKSYVKNNERALSSIRQILASAQTGAAMW